MHTNGVCVEGEWGSPVRQTSIDVFLAGVVNNSIKYHMKTTGSVIGLSIFKGYFPQTNRQPENALNLSYTMIIYILLSKNKTFNNSESNKPCCSYPLIYNYYCLGFYFQHFFFIFTMSTFYINVVMGILKIPIYCSLYIAILILLAYLHFL